jgi:hypothetical protein
MSHENDDVDAGAKIAETGFKGGRPTDDQVNQAQLEKEARLQALKDKLDGELREAMLKHLDNARAEIEAGTLHGLVMVRVNDEHLTASSVAICNMAAGEVGAKLQELAMDLMLPAGAAREIRGLMELLGSVGRRRN